MKIKPVAIHSEDLNDLVDCNSIPDGWDSSWFDESFPKAPEGWYMAFWPEHVIHGRYNSDCTICKVAEPEFTIHLNSWPKFQTSNE